MKEKLKSQYLKIICDPECSKKVKKILCIIEQINPFLY